MTLEVLDITAVSCDERTALAEIDVWSPTALKVVQVRCAWTLGDRAMRLVSSTDPIGEAVVASHEVLDDIREMLLYQRDLNRDRN